MDWMADLVQHPEKQGEVAIVLRGDEGTGKGILARALKYLLGQHGFAISNAKHLPATSTPICATACSCSPTKRSIAGDKAHVGILKSIITEPYLTIEGKYQNAVQTPNRLHIMLATNETMGGARHAGKPALVRARRRRRTRQRPRLLRRHHRRTGARRLRGHAATNCSTATSPSNLRKVPVTDALMTQRKLSLRYH